VRDVVHELVATDGAIAKLGARDNAADEPTQPAGNRHVIVHNPRDPMIPVSGSLRL
jgi:hypothetical protein